jgi:biopolymer transport protein TolR
MTMTGGNGERRLMSDIDVTPLVDVMLVLLIIFMVTAPMMTQGVDVNLPKVSAEPLETEKEPLIVTVDPQGRIFIIDFEVSVDGLSQKLAKVLESRSDREVYLKADAAIPYGTVVRVMAEIKAAGVDKLGMVTDPSVPETKEEKDTGKEG